jgi:hypothetical protein
MDFAGPLAERDYPDPPRVNWQLLSAAFWILNSLIAWRAPVRFQELLESLVLDAWAFYLCLWIRKLDPDSLSPFWCDVYVVVELSFAGLSVWQQPSAQMHWISDVLGLASGVLGVTTIFLIRRDLLKHYNGREDFTLILDPVMTLFFSFVYFQYHLYDIAQQKMKERRALITT